MPPPGMVPVERRASLPFVVVGVTTKVVDDRWLDLCDVVVEEGDPALGRIEENLTACPITGATLALLFAGSSVCPWVTDSWPSPAAYSVLQSGPEFAAWRATHPARTDRDEGPRVGVQRDGTTLALTLTRPQRLNALDAQMRDELVEALTLAAADPSITRVEFRGEGRAFCAGGDLDEFGTRSDPASAHLIRLQRSVARALSRLNKETVTYLHGACVGSGIELRRVHRHRRGRGRHADLVARDRSRARARRRRDGQPAPSHRASAHGLARVLRLHHRRRHGAEVGAGGRARALTRSKQGEPTEKCPVSTGPARQRRPARRATGSSPRSWGSSLR